MMWQQITTPFILLLLTVESSGGILFLFDSKKNNSIEKGTRLRILKNHTKKTTKTETLPTSDLTTASPAPTKKHHNQDKHNKNKSHHDPTPAPTLAPAGESMNPSSVTKLIPTIASISTKQHNQKNKQKEISPSPTPVATKKKLHHHSNKNRTDHTSDSFPSQNPTVSSDVTVISAEDMNGNDILDDETEYNSYFGNLTNSTMSLVSGTMTQVQSHEEGVMVGLAITFGLFIAILTAYQVKENPEGLYSNCCLLLTLLVVFMVKIVCFPCYTLYRCKSRRKPELVPTKEPESDKEVDLQLT